MTSQDRWPTDDQVARLPLGSARADLMEEIMSTPRTVPETTDNAVRAGARPRWAVTGAAAAIAAIIAVPVWIGTRGDQPGAGPAGTTPGTTPAAQGAEPGPYAVLDAAGWRVDYVDGGAADGEISFADGQRVLEIHWRPADNYAGYVEDRQDIGPAEAVEVLGEPSRMWAYSRDDHTTIRPTSGATFLEIRGEGMGEAAYRRLLTQVRVVDADGFAAALPDDVVLPDEVAATVADMLGEVDQPPGLDPADIEVPAFQGSYGVGVAVSQAVTCGWVAAYRQAGADGDEALRTEAVDAMQGSRQWSWLTAMRRTGDWPSSIYAVADAMADGDAAAVVARNQGIAC